MKPIDKLLDCQHVKRWTLVATTAQSTVASHSFCVAMIAMAIRRAMHNTNHFGEQELCYHALLHDVDESETGDMPTPTKMAIREAGVEPNNLFSTQQMADPPPGCIKDIIKMADLIDNYVFIHDHGAGARARQAVAEVHGRLSRAIDEARPDLAQAATKVLHYVLERKSDTDEERKLLAERSERYRQTAGWAKSLVTPVVD